MKNKNKILSFLYKYRKIKSINLFVEHCLLLLIALLSLFTLFIILEKFVFFESYTRIRIDILLISLFVSILSLFIVKLFFQLRGKLEKFENEDIAKEIGNNDDEISDKLINAYQLHQTNTKSNLSRELINRAIEKIETKVSDIKPINYKTPFKGKIFTVSALVIITFIGILLNNGFSNASIRLLNPSKEYEIPKPFKIINSYQIHEVLEGDSLDLIFEIHDKNPPDSIDIIILDKSDKNLISTAYLNGKYVYKMKYILNDFTYWAEYRSKSILNPWDKIESLNHDISIIKRPRINSIDFTVIPPDYSKLEKTYFSANNTDISMLEGSTLHIKATANKKINAAWLEINDEIIPLNTEKEYIDDNTTVSNSCDIVLMCEDLDGIININPPLNRINVINDTKPQIFIANPQSEFTIDDNRIIELDMQIIDDYGFSDAWIEYKIIKPSYLSQDSLIYKYKINSLEITQKAQRIISIWDISNHFLAPDDKIEFYVFVSDNNNITGPSITRVGPFIGAVPSLDDLFKNISNLEDEVIDQVEEITLSVDEVYNLVDELEKELLKSEDVTWEQEQKITESSDKIDEILNDIKSINEMLEEIQEEAVNNDLINKDLINKFNEFQELLDSIMTPEMLESLNKLNEMMNKMSTDQMLSEVQNLKQDISMLEEQLDRFIELFQLAMAEQSLDEFIKMIEEMISHQADISNDLINNDVNFGNLLKRETNQINAYEDLEKSIISNIENIEKISSKAAQSLKDVINGEISKKTSDDMDRAKQAIQENIIEKSFSKSEDVIEDLNTLLGEINNIKNSFNSKMVDEMTVEFINLIRSIEIISFDQELITRKLNEFPKYSPEIQNVAFNQHLIKNKIIKFLEQLIQVSNKTLHIPPGINGAIGSAQLSIQKSIYLMEQKDIKKELKDEQLKALNAINETAYILLSSLNKMQSSMSASGMESYLEELSKIAEGQQQINQGSQQCNNPGFMPGGKGKSIQGELMKRLQKEQEALKKQLEDMLGDMPGEQGSSGLSKAAEDMEEIINDFKRKKITRETIDRQEKILSRMLDSQKSLKQKDYNEKRKSKTAESIIYDGPLSLPSDKGERQTLLTTALQEALEQEYSTDYQIILKKYFKYLEEQELNEK